MVSWDSIEGNVDLYPWSHSANHNPGAVDELIFYSVYKAVFMRVNVNIQDIKILKSALYLHVLTS